VLPLAVPILLEESVPARSGCPLLSGAVAPCQRRPTSPHANGRRRERGEPLTVRVRSCSRAGCLSKREGAAQVVVLKGACHALNFCIGRASRSCHLPPLLRYLGDPARDLSRILACQ
jgi:hypothetical protein